MSTLEAYDDPENGNFDIIDIIVIIVIVNDLLLETWSWKLTY